jgi:zinc transport system permease protein
MLNMLDDFFVRALFAGAGVALIAGPLGCFIVWRRMAYFGDTMAHSALLGIAFAVLMDVHILIGIFSIATLVALVLMALQRQSRLPADALLGILSHSTLAIGLVLIASMSWLRIDLLGYLFGDILAVSKMDIAIIYGGGATVLICLSLIWNSLLAGTVCPELAQAESMRPERAKLIFMLLMAMVIAIAMKIVGILLITAMLIIPAASARRFAGSPEQMAIISAGLGVTAVLTGLFASLQFDTPSGPSIVVGALVLFCFSLLWHRGESPRVGVG